MTNSTDVPKRKLIEVALPLEAINKESAREKSIRHGHPSTLHLWWARRPLAAARAVLFAQLVDDPSSDPNLTEEQQKVEFRHVGLATCRAVATTIDAHARQQPIAAPVVGSSTDARSDW